MGIKNKELFYVFRFANQSGRITILNTDTNRWVRIEKADPAHTHTFKKVRKICKQQTATRVGFLPEKCLQAEIESQAQLTG